MTSGRRRQQTAQPNSDIAKRLVGGLNRGIAGIPGMSRPRRVYLRTVQRIEDLVYERGVETARFEHKLDHFHPEHTHYEPSGWRYLRKALPRAEVTAEDVFLDIGCGKGRILLQAARRYPFRRVVGFEISRELAEQARANLAAAQDDFGETEVDVVHADATRTAIPDDVTVAYMYLPFVGDAFRRTIHEIEASLDRAPRRFRLLFCCPLLEDEVTASGRFELVRTVRGRRMRHVLVEIRVFEARPPNTPSPVS